MRAIGKHAVVARLAVMAMMTLIAMLLTVGLVPNTSHAFTDDRFVTHAASTKVKDVKAKAMGASKVKVAWKKVKGVKTYELRYSANKSIKNAKNVKTKKRSVVVKGLEEGKTYYFQVRAKAKNVHGIWSKRVKVKTSSVEYSITYEANGGTLPEDAVTSYISKAATFELPQAEREGCEFLGWCASEDLSGEAIAQVEKGSRGDLVLHAKWGIDFGAARVDISTVIYDGTRHKPAVSIVGLAEGVDYTTAYGDNLYAGEGVVTIEGVGSVSGSKTYTFDIEQREVALKWGCTIFTYDGTPSAPSCSAGNVIDGDAVRVSVSTSGRCVDAGSYVAAATALDNVNYKLPVNTTKKFYIAKANPVPSSSMEMRYFDMVEIGTKGNHYFVTANANSVGQTLTECCPLPKCTNGIYVWVNPEKTYSPVPVSAGWVDISPAMFIPNDTENYNTIHYDKVVILENQN